MNKPSHKSFSAKAKVLGHWGIAINGVLSTNPRHLHITRPQALRVIESFRQSGVNAEMIEIGYD